MKRRDFHRDVRARDAACDGSALRYKEAYRRDGCRENY
jgi:hypothetical protein